jgi:hypothetical protein
MMKGHQDIVTVSIGIAEFSEQCQDVTNYISTTIKHFIK